MVAARKKPLTEPTERSNLPVQSWRKKQVVEYVERYAKQRDVWIHKNQFFYNEDHRFLKFLIPEGLRVIELGSGLGDTLSLLRPSKGVGVDLSSTVVSMAQKRHPHLSFVQGDIEKPNCFDNVEGTFDVILLSDTIGWVEDCQQTMANFKKLCHPNTRIIIVYYNHLWELILRLGEKLGLRMPQIDYSYLSPVDIANLLKLEDFDVIKAEWRQLLPKRAMGLGKLMNRFVATLPGIRRLCIRNYIIARPKITQREELSATVVVTCRNEKGNVEAAIQRLPKFCKDLEILFVEGHSKDGTLKEIHRVIKAYPEHNIRVIQQDGIGKGNALRNAFDAAKGDVLMILDGDLTTPPEDMPKFYNAIAEGKGEFINGTRLIYPMENQAMQFLNYLANKSFSWIFSFLLGQRFTDTLCGTKVLRKVDYEKIKANRSYFGALDPFGDFDLIFGASKLNLKVVEVPVRYKARTYGSTQISRFRNGWMLLKMVIKAYRKLKTF